MSIPSGMAAACREGKNNPEVEKFQIAGRDRTGKWLKWMATDKASSASIRVEESEDDQFWSLERNWSEDKKYPIWSFYVTIDDTKLYLTFTKTGVVTLEPKTDSADRSFVLLLQPSGGVIFRDANSTNRFLNSRIIDDKRILEIVSTDGSANDMEWFVRKVFGLRNSEEYNAAGQQPQQFISKQTVNIGALDNFATNTPVTAEIKHASKSLKWISDSIATGDRIRIGPSKETQLWQIQRGIDSGTWEFYSNTASLQVEYESDSDELILANPRNSNQGTFYPKIKSKQGAVLIHIIKNGDKYLTTQTETNTIPYVNVTSDVFQATSWDIEVSHFHYYSRGGLYLCAFPPIREA